MCSARSEELSLIFDRWVSQVFEFERCKVKVGVAALSAEINSSADFGSRPGNAHH